MSRTTPITIRLHHDLISVYEMRSIAKQMSLSGYISSLLNERENTDVAAKDEFKVMQRKLDSMQDVINELQDIISNFSQLNNESDGYSQKGYVASIQTLLLLRAMAKPAHIDLVNNKLAELKLPTLS